MSLQAKILNLISEITDPAERMDISASIYYLFQVYMSGQVKEDDIRDSLYEICVNVFRAKSPELLDEEVRKKARELTEEFMSAFRFGSMARRTYRRFRPIPF